MGEIAPMATQPLQMAIERTCEVHFHYALYFYDVLSRGVLATEDANLARFAAYKST